MKTILKIIVILQTGTNLAPVWSVKEITVVRELIAQYETIWNPTEEEKKQEVTTRNVLMRVLSQLPPAAVKSAGDLKTWVYVGDKNTCFHITVSFIFVTFNKIDNTPSNNLVILLICRHNTLVFLYTIFVMIIRN